MKKIAKKSIILLLIVVLTLSIFACGTPNTLMVDNVVVDIQEAVLVVGEEVTLAATVTPQDAANRNIAWTSSNTNVVTVDNNGKCTAVGSGEATVTVTTAEGAKTAQCKIYSGDIIVDASEETETDYGGVLGTSLFKSIGEAMAIITEDSTVIIKNGDYNEDVIATSSVTLIGVDYPVIQSFTMNADDATIILKGLAFSNTSFPNGGEATIDILQGASVTITDCTLIINTTETLVGGYAILVDKQAQKVEITNCTISNYRYGIYVYPTDKQINITNNTFSNLSIGIGVDIRQENSEPPTNYPTTGSVSDNEYNEVTTAAQFFHYGESYEGGFVFADYEQDEEIVEE
ncbi:MAG: hypothetical protein EOM87_03000 [Clostridia bacterium]|nr:hypothetical protein [Clostridia bacterium]